MNDIIVIKRFKSEELVRLLVNTVRESIEDHTNLALGPDLSRLHNYITPRDINQVRLKSFSDLNRLDLDNMLKDELFEPLCSLLGPDILIQTKMNISIQMPDDTTSLLRAHSDCNSGDSPFQLNLWIPLTKAYESNSMFIYNEESSERYYNNLVRNKFDVDYDDPETIQRYGKFMSMEVGEYLIFPPSLIHGNTINHTEATRISVNIRFKSIFSPDSPHSTEDRKNGVYYRGWTKSPQFRWASVIHRVLKNG